MAMVKSDGKFDWELAKKVVGNSELIDQLSGREGDSKAELISESVCGVWSDPLLTLEDNSGGAMIKSGKLLSLL